MSPSTLEVKEVPLTPEANQNGFRVRHKVFWKTTRFWTDADIEDYHRNAPAIAKRLYNVEYWDKDGKLKKFKATCEDFALLVLCEYAAPKELPVKLTTGVRTYRNMEQYNTSRHDRYASTQYGFAEMVMRTFGAKDMQRVSVNTVPVDTVEELRGGDILAQARDREDGFAHHIQVFHSKSSDEITIFQGNSGVMRFGLLGFNPADPQNVGYTGKSIQLGVYRKEGEKWNYRNLTTPRMEENYLKRMEFYRWNFMEFNK